MALSKIADARELSDQELVDRIATIKLQLFELRMKQATRQEVKPHQFKHARHELAQLMTVTQERSLHAVTVNK
ncbi:MAG: 50S ribosomal protein L29 [Cyanobacteria bacterium WB6_1B_304]|jgi:large subunit ribosomal protein L29|nr:50S ribosomal protein L29 [Cyanobacteria bacterium WB6_1B_304]